MSDSYEEKWQLLIQITKEAARKEAARKEAARKEAARKESVGKIAFIVYPPKKFTDPPLELLGTKINYGDEVAKFIGPDTEKALKELNEVLLPSGLKCIKVNTTIICCGNVVFKVILVSQEDRVSPWSITPGYWNCECGGIYSHIC